MADWKGFQTVESWERKRVARTVIQRAEMTVVKKVELTAGCSVALKVFLMAEHLAGCWGNSSAAPKD